MRSWLDGELSLPRRLLVAAIGLGLAALLFRSAIADGLVTRGDELLVAASLERAQVYYARALRIDASPIAAERFAFAGLMRHTRSALRDAIGVANGALDRMPGDTALLVDRALARIALGEYGAACLDFQRLGAATGNAAYYEFAAQAARRAGARNTARRLFERVLRLNPHFAAARRALAMLDTHR